MVPSRGWTFLTVDGTATVIDLAILQRVRNEGITRRHPGQTKNKHKHKHLHSAQQPGDELETTSTGERLTQQEGWRGEKSKEKEAQTTGSAEQRLYGETPELSRGTLAREDG
jgi:hypothetical protein